MLTLECANKILCQNYTVIYCRFHHYGTALPEEQLGQHEILRAQAVCGRRLRMTSFLLKGAAPPSPLLCECEHSFLLIICAYCYMLVFNIRLSVI